MTFLMSLKLILLFLAISNAQHAFDIEMTCEKGDDANSKAMDEHSKIFLKSLASSISLKENSHSTLGIVVGLSDYPGGVYFSAITALKVSQTLIIKNNISLLIMNFNSTGRNR